MRTLDVLTLTIFSIIGIFAIATSIPLGSPHIYAYCLLSQMGTVAVDDDAFRIFCLKQPTDPLTGVDDSSDKRVRTLYEYENYDRVLPQNWAPRDRVKQEAQQ